MSVSSPAPPLRVFAPLLPVDHVRQRVARAVPVARPGERQILEVVAQCPGHRAQHQIDALVRAFSDHVASAVDNVGIVAIGTGQGVIAGAAIEPVVAVARVQCVVSGATDQRVVAPPAAEPVGGAIACDQIVQVVACPIDRR